MKDYLTDVKLKIQPGIPYGPTFFKSSTENSNGLNCNRNKAFLLLCYNFLWHFKIHSSKNATCAFEYLAWPNGTCDVISRTGLSGRTIIISTKIFWRVKETFLLRRSEGEKENSHWCYGLIWITHLATIERPWIEKLTGILSGSPLSARIKDGLSNGGPQLLVNTWENEKRNK